MVLIAYLHIYRKYQRKLEFDLESEDLTVIDFTLHFKGLPKELDAKDAE